MNCESNIDDCVNNSCSNGSTCIDGDNSYTCACPLTHTGKYWYIYDHIFEDNANQRNLEMWQVLLPWLLKSWLVHIFCVFLWNTQLLPFTALYAIQHYVIKFVSDLRQIDSFLQVLWFPPPIKLTATIQSSRNVSVLSDMTSKIWADFAKDWHKIGILQ